ncbi:hypothetical protein M2M59_11695 [Rummeliibacillus sp. G93]|uniref:DUF3226 domain-containing protein n=1 Tax=Rummeliibacillus sp. G93 TaxID=2939494 RepID=UPI00201BAF28|nr:DUF3226 domain-containing protein [Rummeliibacillus sp. G93]UQW96624.1 hypothetical protein M2M59_11695 [Rummeliibacillus sp. G93]
MPTIPNSKRITSEEDSRILKPKLLLVEGNDEVIFFKELIKRNELLVRKENEIQIVSLGGVEKFKTQLAALKNRTGFENVKSMAVIRDADSSKESAFQSISKILTNNGFSSPSEQLKYSNDNVRVGIFIMPGSEEGTMLEDLCLRTNSDHPLMDKIDFYIDSLSKLEGFEMPRNISKTKTLIFLASMPKIVNNLGLGAQRGYWNLNHACLNPLINFINEL